MKLKKIIETNPFKCYVEGVKMLADAHYKEVQRKTQKELAKTPLRTDIINFLLSKKQGDSCYLEIGVRNPEDNFNHIKATQKYSVDPGVEFEQNPVDFKMTSDVFFQKLDRAEVLSPSVKFDVIFIDGLHLAEQVDRDIENALRYIREDGFVVLHDCNPPTEWHSRESYMYLSSPAHGFWNGTTWKAFLKWRFTPSVNSCCVDADWGVGVLSKTQLIGESIAETNPFFEFNVLDKNRKEYLNLTSFEEFKTLL